MLHEWFSFDPDVKGEYTNNKNLHPIIRGIFIVTYFPQNSISISMKVFVNVSKQFINIFFIENIISTLQIRIWNRSACLKLFTHFELSLQDMAHLE